MRAGDALFVTGELGGAALGLHALQTRLAALRARAASQRWRRPRARIAEGSQLAGVASAAIDVSDGLLQDLAHLAAAAGVGFELEAARLPLHPELVALAPALKLDPGRVRAALRAKSTSCSSAPPRTRRRAVGTRIGRAR